MKINFVLLPILMCLSLLLLGCDRKEIFPDLEAFILKVEKNSAVSNKKTANVLPQLKAVTYQKDSSRTPFEDAVVSRSQTTVNRNPLNMYPLNLLRFLGTVTEGGLALAYIMTPDSKVYQVKIGDSVGDQGGKIVEINTTRLEVVEQPMEEGKQGVKRIVTLQLKDEG